MKPSVSVVIAVFNGERFIAEAIRSVLAQDYEPLELIVVDDGSTDATADAVRAFDSVRYVYQPNAGQGTALNHGLRLAGGDLIAFNDADDVWTPGRLALQAAALAAEPELDAVFGHVEQFLEADAPAGVAAGLTPDRGVQPSRLHTAILVRRAALERVGAFREDLRITSVVEWAGRAKSELRHRVLDHVVLRRRIHGQNIGLTKKQEAAREYLLIARDSLARRRGNAN